MLFGVELDGGAGPVARVAGFALVSLAIACWRGAGIVGMLVYNASVASYFLWLGIQGEWVGQFLWPAVVVHTVMTAWNAWDFARGRGDASAAIRGQLFARRVRTNCPSGFAPEFCGSGLRPRIRYAESQPIELQSVIGVGDASYIRI